MVFIVIHNFFFIEHFNLHILLSERYEVVYFDGIRKTLKSSKLTKMSQNATSIQVSINILFCFFLQFKIIIIKFFSFLRK